MTLWGKKTEAHAPSALPFSEGAQAHGLHPLLGTLCRTLSFHLNDAREGVVYWEAVAEMPLDQARTADRWSVREVRCREVSVDDPSSARATQWDVKSLRQGLSFHQALLELVAHERHATEQFWQVAALTPTSAEMGFLHFKAFAEREGYVFDVEGVPHARPHPLALPMEGRFDAIDVERADRHVQRTEEEFLRGSRNNGVPAAHFLFEHFYRVARQERAEPHMKSARVLAILDRYMEHLEAAQHQMQLYCERFDQQDMRGHLELAQRALDLASGSLRQIKTYGVDVRAYEGFTHQCRVAVDMIQTQGLHWLLEHRVEKDEKLLREYHVSMTETINAFRLIDKSEPAITQLKNMIEQGGRPAPLPAITLFLQRYKANRESGISGFPAAPSYPPVSMPPPHP